MLQVSNLKKSYSTRVLFEGLTFALEKSSVVGLVGRNGSGKSTLFKCILGHEQSDEGTITTPNGYKVGYLDQHISFTKDTLLEECVQALPKELEYEHYRAEKILFGLGFTQEDMEKAPTQFSGGYQLRINLCKCLLAQPDCILLDEPTNYLDIPSLRWLRQFLNSFRGEAVIITHDRGFMDSVVTHIMGIHRKTLRMVKGKTPKYYEQLAQDEEIYNKTMANQQKKLAQMERFVERFRAKASKATQAQSMVKKIEKLNLLTQLDTDAVLGFRFNYLETPAKRLLEVKNLSFGFEDGEPLFSDLNFEVKKDDRIAVIGKNGKGKTTLLNVLAGQLKAWSGEVKEHPTLAMGYYQQTNRKDLNPSNTVAEEIGHSNIDLDMTAIRSICGAVMFPGDDANKKIKVLSGGEQGRVLLGKVLAHKSNLLLLDEPTNHLDMESIEVMTEEVDQFSGPVLMVTHNEELLKRLATKLIVFRDGDAEVFSGNYDEFLEKIGWDESGKKPKKSLSKADRKEQKRLKALKVQERSKKLKPLKKQMSELEEKIGRDESALTEKNNQVAEGGLDDGALQEVYKEIGQLQLAIESSYSELEELSRQIDQISQEFE